MEVSGDAAQGVIPVRKENFPIFELKNRKSANLVGEGV
jgi:hypothetical protein